jgi:mRNA interferase RelE/StbE
MYNIVFDKSAEKDLDRLSNDNIKRVINAIAKLENDPKPQGVKKLQATNEDLYRIRVGDYRVIYAVEEAIKIVNVRKIRHRRDIYRNL